MPKFSVWSKGVEKLDFERVCEIDQVNTTGTDNVRDEIAGAIAAKWMADEGAGLVEFRNQQNQVLIRITRP